MYGSNCMMGASSLLALVVLLPAALATDSCSAGNSTFCHYAETSIFHDVGRRVGHPYKYYLGYMHVTHKDAQHACGKVGGHLLEIDTVSEFRLLQNALDGVIMNSHEIHIGGIWDYGNQHLTSPLDPSRRLSADWHSGHPANQWSCVTLFRKSNNRGIKMGSISCDVPHRRFICEI